MIAITLSDVKLYFDQKAILTPAEKFQKNLLDKFGLTVRKTQKNSMKRGLPGQASAVGKPPLRHSTKVDIKETVFSFTDFREKNVVIGMVLLSGKPSGDRAMPGVLEHAGTAQIVNRATQKIKTIMVQARPSAQPAFEKTIKKQLPGLIEGGIMREV